MYSPLNVQYVHNALYCRLRQLLSYVYIHVTVAEEFILYQYITCIVGELYPYPMW